VITFNEFKELDLRIGKVKEKKEGLAVVDFGEKQLECKINGLELVEGEQVVALLLESQAMLLAAKDGQGAYKVVSIDESVPAGAKVE